MAVAHASHPVAAGDALWADGDALRAAMDLLPAAVTVITTCDRDGRPIGCTATGVGSVSLHPPLVLACVPEESDTLAGLLASRRFAINVVDSAHPEVSARAAGWDEGALRVQDGVPLLTGALATLRCELHDVADGGDRAVLVGHVVGLPRER